MLTVHSGMKAVLRYLRVEDLADFRSVAVHRLDVLARRVQTLRVSSV